MRLLFRKMIWRLFGVPSVALIDHDGEITAAFARRDILGRWFAYRFYGIGVVTRLHPFGACSGPCYVHSWTPLVGALGVMGVAA